MDLEARHCVPCEGDVDPLSADAADRLLAECPGWHRDGDRIHLDLEKKDFMACIDAIQKIAAVAEDEGHHPDLHLTDYRHLRVSLQTHAIGGLSENDFILAAKISRLVKA